MGNDCYTNTFLTERVYADYTSDKQPIASGTWNPATDAVSQADWNIRVGSAIGQTGIIQAGNWNEAPPKWGAAELIAKENATAEQYVRHYAHHNYPGGTVQKLQTHSQTASNIRTLFDADVAAARAVGKEYVLGETNSGNPTPRLPLLSSPFSPFHNTAITRERAYPVSGGGAATVSPTFGAVLWTMDYALRAAASNISRVYFHHGTVGNCQYCFWGRAAMGTPYHGATAAVALRAGARWLAALDDGRSNYAAYASFDVQGKPLRVLLYNSDYFDAGGSGARGGQVFTLTGLGSTGVVKAKRLTAAGGALARVDRGDQVLFGGQWWGNGTCVVGGKETIETVSVEGGQAAFELKATEALIVYLQ